MGRILWGRGAGRDLADEPGTGLRDYMQTLGAIKATLPFVDPLFKRIWTEAHRPDATPRKKAAAQKLIDGLTPEQKARLDKIRSDQAERVGGLVTPLGGGPLTGPAAGPQARPSILSGPPPLIGPQRFVPGMGPASRVLGGGRQYRLRPGVSMMPTLAPQAAPAPGPEPPAVVPTPMPTPSMVPKLKPGRQVAPLTGPPPEPELLRREEPEDRPTTMPPAEEAPPKAMFEVAVPVVGGSIDVGEFARRLRQKNLAEQRERTGGLPEDLSQYSLAQLRAIRKLAKTPADIVRLGEAARARGRFELAPGLMDALGGRTGAGKGERYVLDELPKQMTALDMQMIMAKISDLRSKGRNREAQALERMARSGLLQAKTGLTRAKLARLLAKMRGRKGGPGVLAWMRKNPNMLRATQVKTAGGNVTVWVPKKGLPRADLLFVQRMAARANRLANPRLSRKQIIQAARDLKKHTALTEHRKQSRELKKAQVDALRLFGDLLKPSGEE